MAHVPVRQSRWASPYVLRDSGPLGLCFVCTEVSTLRCNGHGSGKRRDGVVSSVSILCRQEDGDREQCGLVLGVFPTPVDAMVHAETKERLMIDEWEPPRPGKRRWMHERGAFVFVIEEYPLQETIELDRCDDAALIAD